MFDYSRKRFGLLKERFSDGIILLTADTGKLWTYDNDAESLAENLGKAASIGRNGAFLVVSKSDLEPYALEGIEGEAGAIFLPYEEDPDPIVEVIPSLPSSALVQVELLSDAGEETITIVSDQKEQNGKKGIYGDWREFSKAILQAIDTGEDCFNFNKKEYIIASVYRTPKYEELLVHRYHFLDPTLPPQTLLVSKSKSCAEEAGLEAVTALFFYSGSRAPACMSVFYSPQDNLYFVNAKTYDQFRDLYGLPYVALKHAPWEKFPKNAEMSEESILHLYGYNVSEDSGFSDRERQSILARLIDYQIVSKGKISNHLEFMVFLGEKNDMMANAVEKWKRDLRFVNTYKITEQRAIWVSWIKEKN